MMVKSKGFTLIELLVVISILGLLMGILVPVLGKAKASANRTSCASNLRQIGVAFRSYLDDNRDVMPPACAYPWDITDANDPCYSPPITKYLNPILRDPKVFICRADKKYYLMAGGISYYYNGRQQRGPFWTNGLGGKSIAASNYAQDGVKERNIDVMSDFDAIHSGVTGIYFMGTYRERKGQKNFLYADWHVNNYKNQD